MVEESKERNDENVATDADHQEARKTQVHGKWSCRLPNSKKSKTRYDLYAEPSPLRCAVTTDVSSDAQVMRSLVAAKLSCDPEEQPVFKSSGSILDYVNLINPEKKASVAGTAGVDEVLAELEEPTTKRKHKKSKKRSKVKKANNDIKQLV
eukprot:gene10187-11233_t